MKSLYLLRHAKSSWDKPDLADHDRPLAPRGRAAARRLAVYMRKAKVRPELVLCSSAVRAWQTYKAIAPALGASVEVSVEDALYGASSADLLDRLRVLPEQVGAVLLIGHNPAMQELATELAGDGDPASLALLGDNFPTGALAALDVPGRWAELGPGAGVPRVSGRSPRAPRLGKAQYRKAQYRNVCAALGDFQRATGDWGMVQSC